MSKGFYLMGDEVEFNKEEKEKFDHTRQIFAVGDEVEIIGKIMPAGTMRGKITEVEGTPGGWVYRLKRFGEKRLTDLFIFGDEARRIDNE